ncbi:cyclic nucleotide-binding domain-containing protein [Ruegeria hyattellae]|uniref:cyclic nucleotide-binding domain-containing protein n=1 Tax=Ruegeria hyattellae TaxID=3233337 RepID=UPI00355B92E3
MYGLDILVNIANVAYLCSYSVRDIFWLRVLSVIGGALLLPYYYLQAQPLWAALGWNIFFIAINLFWIIRLLAERRPVPFSDEERRLYRLALRNLKERDAFNLFRMGQRASVPNGDSLLQQGQPVNSLMLIVDGEVDVEINGTRVDTLGPGRFLGSTALLSQDENFSAPVTVSTTKPTTAYVWKFDTLNSAFSKNADLQIAIEASLGMEVSRYLRSARAQLIVS